MTARILAGKMSCMADREILYGLDGQPITLEEWARLREAKHSARSRDPQGESTPEEDPTRVASTHVGVTWISTVWLGINHQYGNGPPLIFESMVFGGPMDQEQQRYSTKEQALAGHDQLVAEVREKQRATHG